jgi:hypothetical protein
MNFIKELTYGTLSGGIKNGFLMYEVVLNGEPPLNDSAIAEVLERIRAHGTKCKRVNISGIVQNHPYVEQLLKSLRFIGFDVFVETSSIACPSWYSPDRSPLVSFLSVHIAAPHWAPYPFHELIYKIDSAETPEPAMPDGFSDRFAPLFLEGAPTTALLAFARKAHLRWNINCKVKPIKEYLYRSEAEA